MRNDPSATSTTGTITTSSSLDLVSRQASASQPQLQPPRQRPQPIGRRESSAESTTTSAATFLRLPDDPASSNFSLSAATGANNNRARSRSFDFSHHHSHSESVSSIDFASSAAVSAAGGGGGGGSGGSGHGGSGGGGGGGSGPLLGMLRRSFSRHSSTSDSQQPGQHHQHGTGGNNAASSGSLPAAGSAGQGVYCVHCLCVEEYERLFAASSPSPSPYSPYPWCYSPHPPMADRLEDHPSESEYDSNRSSSCSAPDDLNPSSMLQLDEELLLLDAASSSVDTSRLSFLGESFECRQKVEPWIRENELAPDSAARAHIRRGRSLGLASDTCSPTVLLGAGGHSNLRRGGSECHYGPQQPEEEAWTRQQSCQISFNFSFSTSDGDPSTSVYQVSETGSTTPVGHVSSGRRSPGGPGTPRLERQEALRSGWLGSEPSLDLSLNARDPLAGGGGGVGIGGGGGGGGGGLYFDPANDDHSRGQASSAGSRTHASMETHASVSLEVDSGACLGGVPQQASLESQYSLPLSLDVHLPESARQRRPVSSFESETSVDSMASSNVSAGAVGVGRGAANLSAAAGASASSCAGGGRNSAAGSVAATGSSGYLNRSSLLARRKCLSAGASPSSSPPICLSNSRCNLSSSPVGGVGGVISNSRLNLCTGSSSEYGDQADLEATPLSPSPPAEIYLTVPVLPPLAVTMATSTTSAVAATKSSISSSSGNLLLDKSRHLRQRFRRNDSSRSSSDKDRVDLTVAAATAAAAAATTTTSLHPSSTSTVAALLTSQRSLTTTNARGLSRSGDSLHPRSDLPLRSRSIEIGLPTAHHHHYHHQQDYHHHHHHLSGHHHDHHHRTEYHDLAGSARRQQWVSRLKYVCATVRFR